MKRKHTGYVITDAGTILVQVPSDCEWGFAIADDDRTWPGGVGVGPWTAIPEDDPRITYADRQRLKWILIESGV